jgi:hypothetical protein
MVVSMSQQEFSRLEVLLRVQSGRLRVADACSLIGVQRRQVFRLLRGLKQDGATSLLTRPPKHALGLVALALLPAHPAPADIVWRMTICGLGFGFFNTPNNGRSSPQRRPCGPVAPAVCRQPRDCSGRPWARRWWRWCSACFR